jgi:transcription antitermination protein NusB
MHLPAPKFRELVFQLLFSFDANGEEEVELIPFLMRELSISKKHVSAAYEKGRAIWRYCEQLDHIIVENSKEYSLERIKSVEKSVLRLALYELLIEKELTAKIIISEAHRLTRKFSTVEGASFVNALLDTLEKNKNESPLPPSERTTSL